ncbi:MAG: hypothetical protein DLM70_02470 [Chloroflexi bacterium]|nr:MAG: hypothetical protein DLM70_02470 [Chloroflexota bacterium]
MAYQIPGTIRAYDGPSDSCTVEMTGNGAIDTWLTGIKVDVPVNRAFLVPGQSCTLSLPDANRLCEARVISIVDQVGNIITASGSVVQVVRTGQAQIMPNGAGGGSTAVVFSSPFSAAPTVSVYKSGQGGGATGVSAITLSGCTLTITGAPPNYPLLLSYTATGAQ